MNAIEYIKSSLSSIAARIPEIGLRYAFDPVTSFHIIEVYPESIRRGNEQYMELEYQVWKEFHALFPNENLLISEIDSTNNMNHLIFEKKPANQIYTFNLKTEMSFRTFPSPMNRNNLNLNQSLVSTPKK